MNRNELDTILEKKLRDYVRTISDDTYSFTFLFLKKNGFEIDKETLKAILDVVEKGIKESSQRNFDSYKEGVHKALNEFTESQNPLQHLKPGKK